MVVMFQFEFSIEFSKIDCCGSKQFTEFQACVFNHWAEIIDNIVIKHPQSHQLEVCVSRDSNKNKFNSSNSDLFVTLDGFIELDVCIMLGNNA